MHSTVHVTHSMYLLHRSTSVRLSFVSYLASRTPVERVVGLDEISRGVDEDEDVDVDVVESDQSEKDVDVLLRNDENDNFDDDGQKQVSLPELNDNLVPFFTNVDGVDDSTASQGLYHRGPKWLDVNPKFTKGMIFKYKDVVT